MQPSTHAAIQILDKIKAATGAASLAYWVTPNTILTLSGARAYCDGVFWSDKPDVLAGWKEEISQTLTVIQAATPLLYSKTTVEEARPGEHYTSFELITKPGLQYKLEHTTLLEKADTNSLSQVRDMASLQEKLIALLGKTSTLQGHDKEDLNHAAFGILLGYPDEAIVGLLEAEQHGDDPFAEPVINADIRGADYYVCPKPVYMYPRHLIDNPSIKAHEQLWSQILDDYYHSPFHRSLEQDEAFQQKMSELGGFR